MGKASKKAATKIDAAPAAAPPAKLGKQGKRQAGDEMEKKVVTKKQKKNIALEQAVQKQKVEAKIQKKKVESSSEDESESEEEKAPTAKVVPPVAAKNGSVAAAAKKNKATSSSDEESEEDSEAEGVPSKITSAVPKNNTESSDSDEDDNESGEDESDSDEDKVPSSKSVVAAKASTEPKTPAAPQGESKSSTLFIGNLSFNIEKTDIDNFFKDAGTVVDVRFAADHDGRRKGFGHVEFETAEAAQKAIALNGELLLNREVKLDFAREKGSYTPSESRDKNSSQKGGRSQTVFVRGFDSSLEQDEVRNLLQEHFGGCGEITRMSVPKDYETGSIKGYAYIDFSDSDSFNEALELTGSELGDGVLTVEEAKPRLDGDSGGRGRGRGDRGRGFGRGDRGRGFGRGDRGRGFGRGRFGDGGRSGGRGSSNRGRGFNKPSFHSGKKTTFDD